MRTHSISVHKSYAARISSWRKHTHQITFWLIYIMDICMGFAVENPNNKYSITKLVANEHWSKLMYLQEESEEREILSLWTHSSEPVEFTLFSVFFLVLIKSVISIGIKVPRDKIHIFVNFCWHFSSFSSFHVQIIVARKFKAFW